MSEKYELDIWSGDWGLPSIDYSCLQVISYCRFSNVSGIKINQTNNPWWAPNGILPTFKLTTNHLKLSKVHEIINYLKSQNYNPDLNLSGKDRGDINAYTSLLKQQLEPAINYICWIDDKNYVNLIRPWYAKKLPFPTNYFVPGRIKNDIEKYFNTKFSIDLSKNDPQINSMVETAVFGGAQKCLTLLSERLQNEEFFFGKDPCSFDALVFGYLAPLLKVPFPNATLQNHLKACDNLVRFVNRILQRYFALNFDFKSKNSSSSGDKPNKNDDDQMIDDFPHKWRDIILSGLFAMTAMVGYAFASGLIKIEIEDTNDTSHEPDFDMQSFLNPDYITDEDNENENENENEDENENENVNNDDKENEKFNDDKTSEEKSN